MQVTTMTLWALILAAVVVVGVAASQPRRALPRVAQTAATTEVLTDDQ